MGVMTEREQKEVKAVLAFAEKTIRIKTGRKVTLFYEEEIEDELPAPMTIMRNIVLRLGLNISEVQSQSRKPELVTARQIICKILRHHYKNLYLSDIGGMLGGRDHTTVLYSVNTATIRLENDEEYFVTMYKKAVKCVNRLINKNYKDGSVQI